MPQSIFTLVESLWLSGNLPFSSGKAPLMREAPCVNGTMSLSRSGGGHEMHWRRCRPAGNSAGALFIEALQFEVDCTDVRVERRLGGGAFLGRPAPVIGEIRFHCAIPRWHGRRSAPMRVAGPYYPHIIGTPVNRLT